MNLSILKQTGESEAPQVFVQFSPGVEHLYH